MKTRKFRALVNERGLDDGGVASFTFEVAVLTKGKIYEEHQQYTNKGYVPSGYVIDDNSCWNDIKAKDFKKRFEEII